MVEIVEQAMARAKAAAEAMAAKVSKGMSMADAVKQAGVPLPAPRNHAGALQEKSPIIRLISQ